MPFARSPGHSAPCRRGFIAAALSATAAGALAAPFELTYQGYFETNEALNLRSDASPTFFSASTPFTISAQFDDSSPNLAPSPPIPPPNPFDGYRAYAPTSMSLFVAGAHYRLNGTDNPGLTVSIFDKNSFDPGRYAVGIIVDAVADGAGIIGDFSSASPDFTVSALVSTTFTAYNGVGHSSGACMPGTGMAPNCDHFVTPLVLRDAGNVAWNLTLANYELDPPAQALNMASIAAVVPEPSSYCLMLAGMGMLIWATRARRR